MRLTGWALVAFACALLVSLGCSSSDDPINPPPGRFVDNHNGTVKDTQTGLIWLKDANCPLLGPKSFEQANAAAAALHSGQCGLTDGSMAGQWRLPTLECPTGGSCEFWFTAGSLHGSGEFVMVFGPACTVAPYVLNSAGTGCWTEGDPFSGIQPGFYWSSSRDLFDFVQAWGVNLTDGYFNYAGRSLEFPAWAVRNGP